MQVTSYKSQGATRALWRLLIVISIVLLVAPLAFAQKRVLPLEKEAQMLFVTMDDTEGIYFKDVNHFLDKFVGSWKGTSVGGYEVTMQLKIFRKVYQSVDKSYADLLGFKLEITKDGNREKTPQKSYYLIPETDWYRGDGLDILRPEKSKRTKSAPRETNKNGYLFDLCFDPYKPEGYWGWIFMHAQISEDGKTLTFRRGITLTQEGEPIPNYPPYIPKKYFSTAWVLHRVDK